MQHIVQQSTLFNACLHRGWCRNWGIEEFVVTLTAFQNDCEWSQIPQAQVLLYSWQHACTVGVPVSVLWGEQHLIVLPFWVKTVLTFVLSFWL